MLFRTVLVASLALVAACAPDETSAVTGDEQDLSATTGDFKLSLNALAAKGGTARIHGLANQAIEGARAFIPDDEVGSTAVAPKSFTSSFHTGELRVFLDARPAFFSVVTSTEAFLARADLGVKMHIDSPVGIKVTSAASSVLVNGVALVRVKGTFPETLVAAKTQVNGADVAGVVSGKSWRIDFPLTFMADAIVNQHQIWILLTTQHDDFSGELDAALKVQTLVLAQGDPYAIWPTPTCTNEVLACIQKPENAVDTSACGDAFHVAPCWKKLHP